MLPECFKNRFLCLYSITSHWFYLIILKSVCVTWLRQQGSIHHLIASIQSSDQIWSHDLTLMMAVNQDQLRPIRPGFYIGIPVWNNYNAGNASYRLRSTLQAI